MMRWPDRNVSLNEADTGLGIQEAVEICEAGLNEIKEKILKTRELAAKTKTPD